MKDLALHILDIVHNSIRAKATLITLTIEEKPEENIFLVEIGDNGGGISPDILPVVTDPFTTSRKTRKVGLGLALFKQNAEQTGGYLAINSTLGKGTEVKCCFGHHHIDRPPIGDISGILIQLITAFPDIQFVYTHKTPAGEYTFDTVEVKEALDGLSVSNPEVRKYLFEMISENLDEIGIER